jgi:hypothetical protein
MFTRTCVGDEVPHHRLRVGSKNPFSKAAAILTRGAYAEYVSLENGDLPARSRSGEGREGRWRLFSIDPATEQTAGGGSTVSD